MYEDDFPLRLAQLRNKKGVSARDMSLSIGQNQGYINNIETGKALPSMTSFFYICDYLGVTPFEFFDMDVKEPDVIRNIVFYLRKLEPELLHSIETILRSLTK